MRLIKADTLEIHDFPNAEDAPAYAILSHTWGDEECTLQHMQSGVAKLRSGYAKIKYCCQQALMDRLEWAWVDTCCIDKTSSTELSEAINSMYLWYKTAKMCYAYLSDVGTLEDMVNSRWFTRGWTLQELLAPVDVRFYSFDWTLLGIKETLAELIVEITGIQIEILATGRVQDANIATRMSWAATRLTTRIEDAAYCLMGIFDVNMPLLYGEGRKAFKRLQEEILKDSNDASILAWSIVAPRIHHDPNAFSAELEDPQNGQWFGNFASSPDAFALCRQMLAVQKWEQPVEIISIKGGVELALPRLSFNGRIIAALPLTWKSMYDHYACLVLRNISGLYVRWSSLVMIPESDFKHSTPLFPQANLDRLRLVAPQYIPAESFNKIKYLDLSSVCTIYARGKLLPSFAGYQYAGVHLSAHVKRAKEDIQLPQSKAGCHVAIIYKKILQVKPEAVGIESRNRFSSLLRPSPALQHMGKEIQVGFAILFGTYSEKPWEVWASCCSTSRDGPQSHQTYIPEYEVVTMIKEQAPPPASFPRKMLPENGTVWFKDIAIESKIAWRNLVEKKMVLSFNTE